MLLEFMITLSLANIFVKVCFGLKNSERRNEREKYETEAMLRVD